MSLEVVTLQDSQTGSQAKILPGYGFNCFSFQAVLGGEKHEVLWAEAGFESGEKRPSGSGIPILFPFAGRLVGQEFAWEGKRYPLSLAPSDPLGNAIHGFVLNRPWQVLEQSDAQIVGEFSASGQEPEILQQWPADFSLRATYTLAANRLSCRLDVTNPGETTLPFGLGLHPYFRLPLAAGSPADGCRLIVPAGNRWEMVDMLPSGKTFPADENLSAEGVLFAGAKFDDLFGELSYEEGWCRARIVDPQAGRTLTHRFGEDFPFCVIYIPPHREAVCLEPYSTLPDAFRLEREGTRAGLKQLAPGESWQTETVIELVEG